MKIRDTLTFLTSIILLVCGIVGVAHGNSLKQLFYCIANMKQICAAKGSHGLETKLPVGQHVPLERISGSPAKNMRRTPLCPARGVYDPGLFTGGKDLRDDRDAPRCSVHGSLAAFESSSVSALSDPNHYFAASTACFGIAVLLIARHVATRGRTGRRPTASLRNE